MTFLPRLASRVFNVPLLVLPETALALAAGLADRWEIAPAEHAGARLALGGALAVRFDDDAEEDEPDDPPPYVIHDGIAAIKIIGELVNRGSWLDASSGLVSYEALSAALRQAGADPDVRGILLELDSPGGEVAGAMEAAAVVRDVAAIKPVKAYVNGRAASAAYAIAAGADDITVMPSAIVGSIGVVMLHLDRSQALDRAGVKPTLIHAGAYKVDGNPLQALGADARDRIQARINGVHDLFVSSVAAHRQLTETAIRNMEAAVYMGAEAVAAGLADRVGTLDDVLASFASAAAPATALLPYRGLAMANPTETLSRATHDAALASAVAVARAEGQAEGASVAATALAAARAEGVTQGTTAGAAGERERIAAILSSPEAKGRESSALHLALKTGLDVEAARGALAGLAVAPPPTAAPPRTHRLDAIVPRPAVSADGGSDGGEAPLSDAEQGALAMSRLFSKRPVSRAP